MKKNGLLTANWYLLVLVCLSTPVCLSAQTLASAKQVRQISALTAKRGLKNSLLDLQRHYKVEIIFEDKTILGKQDNIANINFSAPIEKNLDVLLKETGLQFRLLRRGTFIISEPKLAPKPDSQSSAGIIPVLSTDASALLPVSSHATTVAEPLVVADITIRGTVKDSDRGEGLPGVNVVIKGLNRGTTTDSEGRFQLAVPDAQTTLVFSFVGYLPQEVQVGSRTSIDIRLVPSDQSLNEVVVVGYGTEKKVNLTGSVATVDPAQLRASPVPTITQALMGRAAGVFIKNVNGQPGENKSNFNIRGFGQALIIIDGLPASNNDFNQLDPNDIAAVSILKDAAAAAVYGARAGNGVVLVTTRRGGVSDAKFTYSGNYGLQFFAIKPEFVNSEQYARMENVSRINQGMTPLWTSDQIQKLADGSDPLHYANTDWWNLTIRPLAPQIQHNLNVQGGTEKIKYFVSGGYFSQQGQERNSATRSNRYNLRSNLDVAITKRLNMALNLSATYQTYYGSIFQLERNATLAGIMTKIFRARPYFPAQYPDPTKLPTMGGADIAPNVHTNPDNVGYKSWNRLTGDAKLAFTYSLPFNIQAKANFNVYRQTERYKEKAKKTPVYNYNPDTQVYTPAGFTNDPSRLLERNIVSDNINQQYSLSWNKVSDKHNFSALAVYEILSNTYDSLVASRIRYDYDIDYLFAGPDLDKDNYGTASQGGRKGVITRFNYDYQGRYLVELNSRLDASPKFPSTTRWGFFPSASVGWRISEEPFLKNKLPFLNNLKLRASYGKLGYDNIGNFQYLQNYSVTSQYIFDGASNTLAKGIRADALANPSITWEKITTTNVGLDFTLWNNLLEGSVDYFYRLRSDVLGTRLQSLPNVVGANLPQVNYARYDNRGIELTLNHRHKIRNLEYSVGGNISWNREKSLYIDQNAFASDEARRQGDQIGQWTDRTWGKLSSGLFQTKEEIANWADQDGRNNATILPGDVKLIDYNRDGRITAEDNVLIGRGRLPKLTYGLNATLAWKGLDLAMLWQGAGQFDFNLLNSPDLSLPFYAGNTPLKSMLTDAYVPVQEGQWLPANTNARWPRYRTDNYNRSHSNYQFSDFWLINGAYLRLKTVQVGYTLPKSLTQKVGADACRIYVSGTNLLTFSALSFLDPEADTSPQRTFGDYYPPVGSYNFGVLLKF
jgi:TonB-linked SusC/RagA family outer membrane protein